VLRNAETQLDLLGVPNHLRSQYKSDALLSVAFEGHKTTINFSDKFKAEQFEYYGAQQSCWTIKLTMHLGKRTPKKAVNESLGLSLTYLTGENTPTKRDQQEPEHRNNDGQSMSYFETIPAAPELQIDSDEMKGLHDMLSQLSERHREVIVKSFLEGLSLNEIAESMFITKDQVKNLKSYGLRQLTQMAQSHTEVV
jgi:RNA polymerase sigma factor (sigma-70 family)